MFYTTRGQEFEGRENTGLMAVGIQAGKNDLPS
jgi:hypothetical protein